MEQTENSEIAVSQLLEKVNNGNNDALAELFNLYRLSLKRMIQLRLDGRVKKRLDTSDVLQELYIEVGKRIGEYLNNPEVPFYIWLRFLAGQKLTELHRHHLGVQMRDANLEVSLYCSAMPEATSTSLAAHLLGTVTAPLKAVVRAESQLLLQQTLNDMEPMDREILVLRHFEEMSNSEISFMLNIKSSTATMRYMRALNKLSLTMNSIPGLVDP